MASPSPVACPGANHTRPVLVVQEGNKPYLLPVTGFRHRVVQKHCKNPTVTLAVNNVRHTAKGRPIRILPRCVDRREVPSEYGPDEIKKYIRSWMSPL